MAVTTRETDHALVLEVSGKITIGLGDIEIREAIDEALASGYRSIVLDLGQVKTIDSAGTGELVAAHRLVAEHGGRLVLTQLSPKVDGVLTATCLIGVLEIYSSLSTALFELAA